MHTLGVQERGGEIALSWSATPAAPRPRGDAGWGRSEPQRVGPEVRPRPPAGKSYQAGGTDNLEGTERVGESLRCAPPAHRSLARSFGSRDGALQASPKSRLVPDPDALGTYQLQCAETDQRAAPGAAAHGAASVPAAPLERDLGAPAVSCDFRAARAACSLTDPPQAPDPAAGFLLSDWGSPPPLLICVQGGRRSARRARAVRLPGVPTS